MKDLVRRLLTGAVYVILLLSVVVLSPDAFDFLFMIFGLVCLHEYKRLVRFRGAYIYIAYLGLWWAYIYLISDFWLIYPLLAITLITNLFLLGYLFNSKRTLMKKWQKFISGLFYVGGGCIFLTMIPYNNSEFAQYLIIGIFIIIWVNDSFAYIVGSLLGKRKLFPSVSPKKTVEGALGGLVFAILVAYLLARFEPIVSVLQWIILTVVIVISGSLGDLLESKLKRVAGVKDSGAILPGHGGMLDRLDSLIFAAPFAYLTLSIFYYVS